MANPQTPTQAAGATASLGFTPEQLGMLKILIDEMKKPYVDPDIKSRKEQARQRLRDQRDQAEADLKAIQDGCNHLRDDNTCRVAWITNLNREKQLYIEEGFCQVCNKHFHPGVKGYKEMRMVPRGKAGLIM